MIYVAIYDIMSIFCSRSWQICGAGRFSGVRVVADCAGALPLRTDPFRLGRKFLGQSMEIFHGDRIFNWDSWTCWTCLGPFPQKKTTLITEIGMLHSHSGWAGTAPVVIRKPYSQSNCTLKISQLIFQLISLDSESLIFHHVIDR